MHSSLSNTTLRKYKVVLVQVLKAYMGNRNIVQLILNLRTDVYRKGWSTSRPGHFIPAENSGTRWIGGWVGPARFSTFLEKRKIFSSCRDSSPGPFSMQRSPYADYAIPCTMFYMLRTFWLVIRGFLRFLLRVCNTFCHMTPADASVWRNKTCQKLQQKPKEAP
jgi:hypothetical protein